MSANAQAQLDKWMGLFSLTHDQVMATYNPSPRAISEGGYYNLKPAHVIQTRDGIFYFQDGVLKLVHDSEPEEVTVTRQELLAVLGEPTANLASRAGKTSRLYVYPEKGFAFSASSSGIDFFDVFAPTDLDTFKATFFFDPGNFVR
jgi:hypothetical protein